MMRSNEKIFDLLVADALMDKWDIELAELSESAEDEQHKFSDEFERKIRRIKNSIGRKDGMKKGLQVCTRLVVIAAAVMGVLFGGLLTQPSVYAAVQNVIRTVFEKYDHYKYDGENIAEDDFDKNKDLGYVPSGYEKRSVYYAYTDVSMTFENENNGRIIFNYGIAAGFSFYIDNERHSRIELTHNGNDYSYYEALEENDDNILLWYDRGYYYVVYAQMSQDEIIKIAENIKN